MYFGRRKHLYGSSFTERYSESVLTRKKSRTGKQSVSPGDISGSSLWCLLPGGLRDKCFGLLHFVFVELSYQLCYSDSIVHEHTVKVEGYLEFPFTVTCYVYKIKNISPVVDVFVVVAAAACK